MKSIAKYNPVQHPKEILRQQALDITLKELPLGSGKIDAVIKLNEQVNWSQRKGFGFIYGRRKTYKSYRRYWFCWIRF